MCEKNTNPEDESVEMVSDDSDSDVSMTDSESSDNEETINDQNETIESEDEPVEDEEEDEVIKAIRRNAENKRDHPPPITTEDFITDISFHPHEDIIAIANIVGDVGLYKYTNEENTLMESLESHTKACRDVEFSYDGKLNRFYENSHDVPVYCLTVLDENLFATGDDDGMVKLWDLRERSDKQIYRIKRNEDYISDIITNESKKYLLISSGDGSLLTVDLQNRKFHMQSEEYEEELTCLGIFRGETKLVSGSSKGKLYLYNWNEFGLHSDAFPGPKTTINSLVPITENIAVTACEDGNLRATHLFPHRHLGVVGQHQLSVENVDICNTGKFIASSSHNNDVKFWNIQYFEDFEKVSHKHKKHERKKDLENNLPSSKLKNASDFFSGLA
ncbi:unnamed protein product [Brassicogethes aeneus]|uniref:WD repeat-containing protein 55 homolog n=1 Tax=Brassicogethes aeneus TaxID=1431903 RepID=A0A9P0B893_BRAAE|nr:unnamed protein product [Brassicogethes aeneus]